MKKQRADLHRQNPLVIIWLYRFQNDILEFKRYTHSYSTYIFCVFPAILFIENEFQISVADRQKYILGGADLALLQLFVQPGQIQPHALQIVLQNTAVHNQLSKKQLLLRSQIQVVGGNGALTAHRKDGQLSVVLENSGPDVRQIKVSLLPAHDHELTQIQFGFF